MLRYYIKYVGHMMGYHVMTGFTKDSSAAIWKNPSVKEHLAEAELTKEAYERYTKFQADLDAKGGLKYFEFRTEKGKEPKKETKSKKKPKPKKED